MQKSSFSQPQISLRFHRNVETTSVPTIVSNMQPTYFQPENHAITVSQGVDYKKALENDIGGCGNKGCPCGSACTCGKHCTCAQVAAMEKCSTNADLNVHLERFSTASQPSNDALDISSNKEVSEIPRNALFIEK